MKNTILIFALILLSSCHNKGKETQSETIEPIADETILLEEDDTEANVVSEEEKPILLLSDELRELIPEGFILFDVLPGDLNKDSEEDYVLIIKATNEENVVENRFGETVDRNRRGIIIAFREGNGYKKIVENRSCFSSENEDGGVYFPPELSININKKSNLEIDYGHGRYGNWGYMFRYQNNAFEMIGFHSCNSRGPVELSKVSINFSTKKKKISVNTNPDGDSGEEVWEETWQDIEIDRLINLQDIGDFDGLFF